MTSMALCAVFFLVIFSHKGRVVGVAMEELRKR
jgi:hypothetical protein